MTSGRLLTVMRVYLPSTLTLLAGVHAAKEIGPAPLAALRGHARAARVVRRAATGRSWSTRRCRPPPARRCGCCADGPGRAAAAASSSPPRCPTAGRRPPRRRRRGRRRRGRSCGDRPVRGSGSPPATSTTEDAADDVGAAVTPCPPPTRATRTPRSPWTAPTATNCSGTPPRSSRTSSTGPAGSAGGQISGRRYSAGPWAGRSPAGRTKPSDFAGSRRMDAVITVPEPRNEPVRSYAPGSPERAALEARLKELAAEQIELTDDHRRRAADGRRRRRSTWSQPHNHAPRARPDPQRHRRRRRARRSTAAQEAAPGLAGDAVRRPGGDLPAGRRPARRAVAGHAQRRDDARPVQDGPPGRDRRRLRADRLPAVQRRTSPGSSSPSSRSRRPGVWNRMDHRPLEGFVYAITPFNFTAIAGNLPTAPALMGNTWSGSRRPTQQFAAHFTMRLLEAAGLPPGVINMVTGDGLAVSEVALRRPGPGRHPLHRLHRDVPAPVAHRRREHRRLPRLPAAGRRDRRQGLRRRAPVSADPDGAAHRAGSAARSSTRGRSARPPPGPTSRARSGRRAARPARCDQPSRSP